MIYFSKDVKIMDKAILDFIADHLRAGWLNGIMKVFTLLGELGIFG